MRDAELTGEHRERIAVLDLAMIGDLICALPAVCSIRKNFPSASITAIVSTSSAAVLKYSDCIDGVITVDKKKVFRSISNLRDTVKEIGNGRFDSVYLFHNSIGSALLARMASIPERIGYSTEFRGHLLTKAIHPPGERLHLAEQRLNLLKRAGLSVESSVPCISVDSAQASETLGRLIPGIDRNRPLVLIAVGSTWPTKIWPTARVSALVNKLPVGSCSVALIGTPDEIKLTESVTCLPVPFYNLVGKTTLDELVHVLSLCAVLVTPDNGPMHIAEALDKPVISIFGPTDPKICGMLHEKAVHLRAESPCLGCWEKKCNYKRFCMDLVTEDEVLTELLKVI